VSKRRPPKLESRITILPPQMTSSIPIRVHVDSVRNVIDNFKQELEDKQAKHYEDVYCAEARRAKLVKRWRI